MPARDLLAGWRAARAAAAPEVVPPETPQPDPAGAAALATLSRQAFEALSAPDPDLAAERAIIWGAPP